MKNLKQYLRPASRQFLPRALASLLVLSSATSLGVMGTACETFDAPPRVFLVDLVAGNLPDNSQPIVVEFSEPVDPATLKVKVALLETDIEGNLGDEDEVDATELTTFFTYDAGKSSEQGVGTLSDDGLSLTIELTEKLPIGPALVLLVEPGLADAEGTAWQVRQRIPFGYAFECQADGTSSLFLPGAYFIVVDVEKPIATQLQLLVWFDLGEDGGIITGQFTNGDRIPGATCGCDPSDACRTVPETECVTPSEKAGTAEEYVDFIPNALPPEGYTFRATACVADQADGTVSFANAPVDVAIEQPPVTVLGTKLTAQFIVEEDGSLSCSGSFVGDEVLLGGNPTGIAAGTFTCRSIPEDQVPADIPKPGDPPAE